MKIGIIREGKTPPDSRVPLIPAHCKQVIEQNPSIEILVQSSPNRCYTDDEYREQGIQVVDNVSECDVLLGVKEVPIDQLISDKTYFFFSHTIKEQPYNADLLRAIMGKNIKMIDYEVLTDANRHRVIAFGVWAGIVGAHNGLYTWGKRTRAFDLPRAKDVKDYAALKEHYADIAIPPIKIVVTGGGRVAQGSIQTLKNAGVKEVETEAFLNEQFDFAVFTKLDSNELYRRSSDKGYTQKEFYTQPELYESSFEPFTKVADLMINAIYWNPDAPAYFSVDDMKQNDFSIKVIADITCDIAPEASIPSTLKASTISDPIFGYSPSTGEETTSFQANCIDMMTIDNLPNELPRDASADFSSQLVNQVLPELANPDSNMIHNATITKGGKLNQPFEYLQNYVNGE